MTNQIPDWWDAYRCMECDEPTLASDLPNYCPACGVWGVMEITEPSANDTERIDS